jgi:membrane protease YdiL (CAAX protease family)
MPISSRPAPAAPRTGGVFPARVHNDVAGAITSVVVVVLLPVLLALAALVVPGPGGNPLASTGGLLRQATGDGIVLVALVVLVSVLGGWRSVLVEDRPARSWWGVTVLVAFVVVSALVVLTPTRSDASAYLGALALGTVAVALVEETVFRGALVAGLRRVAPEWLVWLATCLLFALAHALGSGGAFQLVTTFLLGSACSLARRVSGSLIGAVVVHAVYDAFLGYRTQTAGVPFLVSAAATLLLLVAAVAGLVVALRRPAR